jgi:hypothetical protein
VSRARNVPVASLATSLSLTFGLALGLAGCGGSEEKAGQPLSVSSPEPSTPPGLDTTEPTPPARVARTPASAEEFARYFAHVMQYAVRIRDVTPVFALARDQATCSSCRQTSDYIVDLKKDELWTEGDDIEIGRLRVRTNGATGFIVDGPMTYPRITFVDRQGRHRTQQKRSPYKLDVGVQWDDARKQWQVDDYTFAITGRTSP